jgi:hypothetical protein
VGANRVRLLNAMTEKLGKEADDSRSSAAQHHSVHLEQANRRQATGDRNELDAHAASDDRGLRYLI